MSNTHTLPAGTPANSAGTLRLSVHLPEDWSPVKALTAIADRSNEYGRACVGVCPAQQEARFRDLSMMLISEALRVNELLALQADAIATAQEALARVSLGLAPERHAADTLPPVRLVPGQYYTPEARHAAAREARHDSAAAQARRTQALEALDSLAHTLRLNVFPTR